MSKRLLPLIPAGLAVVQVLPTPEHVTIVTQPQAAAATCPGCGTISRRIHSHYERLLGDLPCKAVQWRCWSKRDASAA